MATYIYENSDPERFQQLVQSLLLPEYPRLQCLPVAQPDGGMDGFVADETARPAEVLQVKFKRVDEAVGDAAQWVIDALEGELPKIALLIERGLKQYVLATNARGTSHPSSGSIARVNEWLGRRISVPAMCLWRDDIDRRLEGSLGVQWRYPEVLSGSDAIHLALRSGITEDRDRRDVALTKFLAYQFSKDAEVRFKQVDLRNDLISLFVDVPATPNALNRGASRAGEAFMSAYGRIPSAEWLEFQPYDPAANSGYWPMQVGTADLLLDEQYAAAVPNVVLEGAPGQGKSTLAQYVCQVHRARLLADESVLAELPDRHRLSAVRFPIKVDLRDFATWLGRRDPFLPENPPADDRWSPEIETFLARQISAQSGDIGFVAYDLTAALRGVPVLLFLDGFDEVASIETRERLIEGVNVGLARLRATSLEIRLVVTSRPAAFVNSPGFDRREFEHLELASLSRELVFDYADRWIRARSLDEQDASDVRRILASKLDLPHIRELVRNPMQLAILLSLIHSVGYSLPDERTELYSSYMDRFLTREADKSPAVRRHRNLLVKIHQHLAWVLQSRAESRNGLSGSVTPSELRKIVGLYLVENGHSSEILDELFTGILERVYVLVQRVEGAYEFEVQPIREYFCAKYLYDTAAAYESGLDVEPRGTKSQRFDALARNAYWTNVARFYAGCYKSGELGGLFLQLEDFREEPASSLTFRPRQLGAMLLGDWVFKEVPKITVRVAKCMFDEIGLIGAATSFGQGSSRSLTLPEGCGRAEIATAAVERMVRDPETPARRELASILLSNQSPEAIETVRREMLASAGPARTAWVAFASESRVIREFGPVVVEEAVLGDGASRSAVRARCAQVLQSAPSVAIASGPIRDELVSMALSGRWTLGRSSGTWLEALTNILSVPVARAYIAGYIGVSELFDITEMSEGDAAVPEASQSVVHFLESVRFPERAGDSRLARLRHGERLVSAIEETFGPVWAAYSLAAVFAGVPSARGDRGERATSLFDRDAGIFSSARRARYWSGGPGWWADQFKCAASPIERMFWVLMLLGWGSERNIRSLSSEVASVVEELEPDDYEDLYISLRYVSSSRLAGSRSRKRSLEFPSESERFSSLVDELKIGVALEEALCQPRALSKDRVVRVSRGASLLQRTVKNVGLSNCEVQLVEIKELYRKYGSSHVRSIRKVRSLTVGAARVVMESPLAYPIELVVQAEGLLSERVSVARVSEVAVAGGWTFE